MCNGIPKRYEQIRNKIFADWEIPPWDIIIFKNKKIGEGKFGEVYLADWKGTEVAIKIMNSNINKDKIHLFQNEFDNLSKLHHPNIIQILGYVEEPFIIVMEYLSNKDLLYYSNQHNLSLVSKIEICLDLLRGIEYLHTRKPKYIIHRDIKMQNVLISSCKKAKIADFGLSRNFLYKDVKDLEDKNTEMKRSLSNENLTTPIGTRRYMAPEITKTSTYSYKIDIWSLGIIFSELFEQKRYNEYFFWNKTPTSIKNIIINHMLKEQPLERLDSKDLILFFNNEKNKYSNKCRCLLS